MVGKVSKDQHKSSKMKKAAFYAVRNGRSNGIYTTWDACQNQVKGFSGAIFKKFSDRDSAQAFVSDPSTAASKPVIQSYGALSIDSPPIQRVYPSVSEKVTGPSPFTQAQTKDQSILKKVKSLQNTEGKASKKQKTAKTSTTTKVTPKPVRQTCYGVRFRDGSSEIFTDWTKCKERINGVRGVVYKKFNDKKDAQKFVSTKALESDVLSDKDRAQITDQFLTNNTLVNLKKQQEQKPTVIYTDGSYRGGQGGIGVYYGPEDPRNISERVANAVDSYSPEVQALYRALQNISKEVDSYEKGEGNLFPKYIVCSDNQAAKSVLDTYGSFWTDEDFNKKKEGAILKAMVKDYNKIQRFYIENSVLFNDHKFEVSWVKGHSGIDGNEAADILAKNGASLYLSQQ